jgi:hypothetical protein
MRFWKHLTCRSSSTGDDLPPYSAHAAHDFNLQDSKLPSRLSSDDALAYIQKAIDDLSPELRALSMRIIEHPELSWQEKCASKWASDFMAKHGFKVQHPAYDLETAFEAVFEHKSGGPVVGFVCLQVPPPVSNSRCSNGHAELGIRRLTKDRRGMRPQLDLHRGDCIRHCYCSSSCQGALVTLELLIYHSR